MRTAAQALSQPRAWKGDGPIAECRPSAGDINGGGQPSGPSENGSELSIADDTSASPAWAAGVKAPRQVTTELIDKLAYHRTECRSYIVTDAGVHDIGQQAGSLCLRWIPPKDGCNGQTQKTLQWGPR